MSDVAPRASHPPGIGIDGYRGGWVAALLTDGAIAWRTATVPAIADLLEPAATIGVDMPIGLLDSGERPCDQAARDALPGGASRVFTTPPRPVLLLGPRADNEQAQNLCRRLMAGKGISRQALALGPRILALEAALAAGPALDVVEVHPEVSFAELAGAVLPPKKSVSGAARRIAALQSWRPDVLEALSQTPQDVPLDDALDALAALWSATRWRTGRARVLPPGATAAPFIAV